jgi:AraC-like DNA-binding protein
MLFELPSTLTRERMSMTGDRSGGRPVGLLVRSPHATVLRDEVAAVTPHEVTQVGRSLDGAVGVVRMESAMLVFVRYGGVVIVESPPTAHRMVATVPLGPMHVTIGAAGSGEVKESGFVLSADSRTLMKPDPWAGALVLAADDDRVAKHRQLVFGDGPVPPQSEGFSPMLTHACRRAWSAASVLSAQTPQPVLDQFLGAVEDQLLTALVLSASTTGPAPIGVGRRYLDALRLWLSVNHHAGVTVTDMAGGVGLSVRQLQAVVREGLGVTPMALLREVRLDRAREMLRSADDDNMTIARAAHACGFAHLGRFSAHYRMHFGEAPSVTLRPRRRSA